MSKTIKDNIYFTDYIKARTISLNTFDYKTFKISMDRGHSNRLFLDSKMICLGISYKTVSLIGYYEEQKMC